MWRYPSSSAHRTALTHSGPSGICHVPRPNGGISRLTDSSRSWRFSSSSPVDTRTLLRVDIRIAISCRAESIATAVAPSIANGYRLMQPARLPMRSRGGRGGGGGGGGGPGGEAARGGGGRRGGGRRGGAPRGGGARRGRRVFA